MLIRLCILLVCLGSVGGLMCYFCTDTTGEDKGNECQTWVRTMRYYRKKFEDKGKYSTDKYVKNCTEYGKDQNGEQSPVYCMIASIQERGNVRSFIRDCSNGKNFFTDEINNQFEDKVVTNDNQTTCRYTGQGYIACVTLCGGPDVQGFKYGYGNFCNGPVSLAVATTISDLLIFFVIMFSSMYQYL